MFEINAEEISIGQGVAIQDGVTITGKSSLKVNRITIGDYVVLHNHSLITGEKPCSIGDCCWFGQNVMLNSAGSLTIGRGVGVGAYSQLRSQGIQTGEGSIAGHCISSFKKLFKYKVNDLPVSQQLYTQGLALPVYFEIMGRDVTCCTNQLRKSTSSKA